MIIKFLLILVPVYSKKNNASLNLCLSVYMSTHFVIVSIIIYLYLFQVTISHSNPDISHRAHNEDQRALEADADMYSETTGRSIGVAPDMISESCQDCHSKTRNADNECLVCRIEVTIIVYSLIDHYTIILLYLIDHYTIILLYMHVVTLKFYSSIAIMIK